MKILCAYSGIQFNVDHFPGSLHSRECCHPVFDIPQKKLLQYTHKWANRELTDTDTYLLYLALLHSTELIEWRVPAIRHARTTSIVEQNMEALVLIVGKMNLISHPAFILPNIAITKETHDLTNSHYWIGSWNEAYQDFITGYKEQKLHDRIVDRENRLQRLIKDAQKPISHYARILADWANDASAFPVYPVNVDGKVYPINEYWKNIIVKCCREEQIFTIPKEHIEKLIEYIEDNLEGGSIYSYTLMQLLRSGLKKQSNYLGLGDIDLQSSVYRLIPDESSIETANRMAMIDSAPTAIPIESNYPSKIAYLRAKVKWDMAQEYQQQQLVVAKVNEAMMVDSKEAVQSESEAEIDSDDSAGELGSLEGEL